MLDTVRQFAHDKLLETGEVVTVHDAHLAYFLRFATEVCASIPENYVASIARMEGEIQNLLAAHVWCDQPHVPAEQGLELVARTRRYWSGGGRFALGRQIFEEALRRSGAERPTLQRADALFSLGQHLVVIGRLEEAETSLAEALSIARDQDARELQSICLGRLAYQRAAVGRQKEAGALAEEAINLARSIGTPRVLSISLYWLGTIRQFQGRFDEAAVAIRDAIQLVPAGDLSNLNDCIRHLAQASIAQGHLDEARRQVTQSLLMARQHLAHAEIQSNIETAARLAAAYGSWERAAWIQGAADAAADRLGIVRNAFDDPFLATLSKKPRECLSEAAYEAEWTVGQTLELATAVDAVLQWLEQPSSELRDRDGAGCGRPVSSG